jgi:glycosyltransferase involved in cell wall biosynthesis
VVQTDAIAAWASKRFSVPIKVLPNPVRLPLERKAQSSNQGTKKIIAVGRLVRQKGFDLLIESFAKIADRHPNWLLQIYGEGAERDALQAQISKSSCSDRIKLMGLADDIDRVYADANLFVLSSRYEGYPNVLLEALAVSCPVVATDCPGATRQILVGGRYGLLIEPESVEALTEALDRMMSDRKLRTEFADHAREAVSELDVTVVGCRWLKLLASLVP